MRKNITIALTPQLAKDLDAAAKRKGVSRRLLVQDLVEKSLFRERLEALRRVAVPIARQAGFFTDAAIFKAIS
jgi:metal-responsive CopG/Arc/MetJ family transcriptional regulator